MRAWRFNSWMRIARAPMSSRFLVALLVMSFALLGPTSVGSAQTTTVKSTADSASSDESGFNVRVREDASAATKARVSEKVNRAIERAKRDAERASAAAEVAASSTPEPPTPPEPPDFDLSESNDLVRFGEDITISEGRVIDGDVVSIGGSVTVLGRVKGDCVSVGGTVHIKGKGVVDGDAVSLGGGVHTSDSASVGGSDVSVGKIDFGNMNRMWPVVGAAGLLGTGAWLVELLVGLMITLFLAWISLLLLRERLEYAAGVVHERFGRSMALGLLGWVLLVLAIPAGIIALVLTGVIAIVILCITIIGIPVALLLIVALILGVIGIVMGAIYTAFLAYLTGAMFLGRRVFGNRVGTKPLMAIAAGVLLIAALKAVAEVVGALSFFAFHPVGMAFGFAASLLGFIIATAGLGAFVVARFGKGTGRVHGGYSASMGNQWGSTPPPPPPPAPAPGPAGPTTTPPPDGTSDAP